MLADRLLRHPVLMQKADPRMTALGRWHALEEIEHEREVQSLKGIEAGLPHT